eukprot:TRINITY_DN7887_c0_g1_i1.p1 TRINITY_DN7887_c0_g1~~TRINITY_DN7887_c0_g1_i1.p1  ORF type:complete len:130 (-),score=23.44 TRINITY_DN7887_c0_g1_i1:134-523(-)
MQEGKAVQRRPIAVESNRLTDWSGVGLFKDALHELQVGCIVRVVIKNQADDASEAIYFEIEKIKDGTVWGKTMDTYRFGDYVGLQTGDVFPFRLNTIIEIPIDWQPKNIQKKLGQYLHPQGKGVAVTGV